MSFITCPFCGSSSRIHRHGAYERKKAKVKIPRFLCKKCDQTFNWLPPFLLAHKHYTLKELEPGLERYVTRSEGYLKVLLQLPAELDYGAETLRQWALSVAGMAKELYGIARRTLAHLKPNFKFEKDKRLWTGFSGASLKGRNQGLDFLCQIFVLREYFSSLVEPEDFLVWLIFQLRLKKPFPTRFADDRMGRIRNNSPGPGPKQDDKAKMRPAIQRES